MCDMPHTYVTTNCSPSIRFTIICETRIHTWDMDLHLWHTAHPGDKLRPIHTCDIHMLDIDSYVWHGFTCVTCHTHRWRQVAAQRVSAGGTKLAAYATRNGCQRYSCGTQQHIYYFNVVLNDANISPQLWDYFGWTGCACYTKRMSAAFLRYATTYPRFQRRIQQCKYCISIVGFLGWNGCACYMKRMSTATWMSTLFLQ